MKADLRRVLITLTVVLFMASSASFADEQWIDATHLFEAEVQSVVSSLQRETLSQQAARFRTQMADQKPYEVGDIETFWTKNIVENRFEQTRAVLKAVGRHCYVFLEVGKSLPLAALEKVRKNFDEVIYPTDTSIFGSEWKPGIDGDERITLLLFDIKDGYSGSGGFVGGYFYAIDSYLQEKLPEHIKSNEREMLYLDINPADPASDRFSATIAHEFQHMIHFNHDPAEYTWVNEACSQIAPYLCGYGHATQILAYMRTPDNSLTAWSQQQMLANYGQVYLWNYYILTQYLNKPDSKRSEFFRRLVSSDKKGIAGYAEALAGLSQEFTFTFDRFCITNFINDSRLGNKAAYAYDDTLGRFHLPVSETVSVTPSETAGEVFLWSADAVQIDLTRARSELLISFSGLLGRFGEDLYNSFTVALVMIDSRGKASPKMSYMTINKISNQLQGGKLTIKADPDYDQAKLIIIAQAPETVDDNLYKKAKALPYKLKIVDKGSTVTRNTHSLDVKALISEYAHLAADLTTTNEQTLLLELNQLTATRDKLQRQVARELAEGNTASLDLIFEMIEMNEIAAADIRPVLDQLADSVRFNAENSGSENFRVIAEKLRAY